MCNELNQSPENYTICKVSFSKDTYSMFPFTKDFEECVSHLNVSHHNRLAKELLNIVSKIMDA